LNWRLPTALLGGWTDGAFENSGFQVAYFWFSIVAPENANASCPLAARPWKVEDWRGKV